MGLFIKRNEDLLITVLRFAAGAVFLWFGIDKWIHPLIWFGYVPDFVWPLLPIDATLFMILQGIVEVVIGLLLVLGRFVRLASAAAVAFLIALFILYGANEITIRDNSLIGLYLALFIHANRTSEKPIPRKWLAGAVSGYLLVLFVSGIMFLRVT